MRTSVIAVLALVVLGGAGAVLLDGATELDEIVRRQQMLVCRAERFCIFTTRSGGFGMK